MGCPPGWLEIEGCESTPDRHSFSLPRELGPRTPKWEGAISRPDMLSYADRESVDRLGTSDD